MSTLAAEFSWASDREAVKDYLRVDSLEDEDLFELWYQMAIEHGDQYLGNDFTDSDGNDLPKPTAIRVGLYEFVLGAQEHFRRAGGIQSVTTGSISETFGSRSAMSAGLARAMAYWWPYKTQTLYAGLG